MPENVLGSRQERLDSLMRDLISGKHSDDDALTVFRSIYIGENGTDSGFRHSYSNITRIMMDSGDSKWFIEKDDNGRLELLVSRLEGLHDKASDGGEECLANMIRKLCDHVNLELVRISYNKQLSSYHSGRLRDTKGELEKDFTARMDAKMSEAETKMKEMEGSLDGMQRKMQRDYIAILGIFSAVVLAFNGGMGFASSALSTQAVQASFPHTVMVVLLVGFVLVNAMAVLLGFVWKLVRGGDGGKVPRSAHAFLTALDIVMLLAISVLSLAYMPEAVSLVKGVFGIT